MANPNLRDQQHPHKSTGQRHGAVKTMFLIVLWMAINIEHDSLKIRFQSQWLCVKRSNVQVSSYQVLSLRLPFPSLRLPGLQYSHRSWVLLEVDIAGYHVGGVEM